MKTSCIRWITALVAGFAALLSFVSAGAAELLLNGGFESPRLASGTYVYGPTNAQWVFSPASLHGGSGITTSGSLFTYATGSTDGGQVAFLQADGNSIAQKVVLPLTGKYNLSYSHAGRSVIGGTLTYEVRLDDTVLGKFTTATGQPFSRVDLQFSAAAGSHTLAFVSTGVPGAAIDQTAFFDSVSLESDFKLVPIGFSNGSFPTVGFIAEAGQAYVVQVTSDISFGLWTTFHSVAPGGVRRTVQFSLAGKSDSRFFRVFAIP